MKSTFIALLSLCCVSLEAQDIAKTMTVSPGTSIIIKSGTTLDADALNLKSTSSKFATVLSASGTITPGTTVNYDRHVNVVGTSGVNGGNDLVSLPVKVDGATFGDFLAYSADGGATPNSSLIPTNGTLFAFGPYNNSNQSYTNYASATVGNGNILERAVGYRAATNSGETLRFTGTISVDTETIAITTAGQNKWNTVGNPYPTYVNSQAFLTTNANSLNQEAVAIYAYNSGTYTGAEGTIGNFTIINNVSNTALNIAPGQGFLVENEGIVNHDVNFTPAMRLFSGEDDFIEGRDANVNQMLRLKAEHATANFATELYFNDNSTQGLDPGYDAALFNGGSNSFELYSHLVADNQGRNMAIQSLGSSDLNSVIIPLGLKAAQGQQVTFSIENSTLPADVEVYLEDNVTNTFTLLNDGDYTFTANSPIAGTGRFYLNIGNATLSQIDSEANSLNLYAANKMIVVKGQLLEATEINVYDTLGREVMTSRLESGSNSNEINATQLIAGIYIVKLANAKQEFSKKVILK